MSACITECLVLNPNWLSGSRFDSLQKFNIRLCRTFSSILLRLLRRLIGLKFLASLAGLPGLGIGITCAIFHDFGKYALFRMRFINLAKNSCAEFGSFFRTMFGIESGQF